jgi:nucleoid-associated protein YejK
MTIKLNTKAMVQELQTNGFNADQETRLNFAFEAAKVAAVAVLSAMHGASEKEMLETLSDSRRLNIDMCRLVARIEVSTAFVRYIHSGRQF